MAENQGYPNSVLQRLHDVELDMLREIDRVCREIGISYWLDSGTCLGAIRHGGFIPWDDDIDIGMPFDDYLRFQQEAPRLFKAGYSLHTCDNTPHLPVLWTKVFLDGTQFSSKRDVEAGLVQGIFIDIFPYAQVDKREKVAKRQRNLRTLYQNLSYLNEYKHPATYQYAKNEKLAALVCSVAHETIARPCTSSRMARLAMKASQAEQPSDNWRPLFAFASLKQDLPGNILLPVKPIQFEGETFFGPADPDRYLTALYGNYMQLPPEDKRHTHTPEILDFGDGVNVMDAMR